MHLSVSYYKCPLDDSSRLTRITKFLSSLGHDLIRFVINLLCRRIMLVLIIASFFFVSYLLVRPVLDESEFNAN